MMLEYRVEKQGSGGHWHLAYAGADGYVTQDLAEQRLGDLSTHMFVKGTPLRVAVREISPWKPVTSQLEQAIERLRAVMVSDGQLGYQDADVRRLIQAVEQSA